MPMSLAKPISVSSTQPLFSMASGSARKVFCTKPPKVAAAHTATKSTKKLMPSPTRMPWLTGVSGFIASSGLRRGAAAPRAAAGAASPGRSRCPLVAGGEAAAGALTG